MEKIRHTLDSIMLAIFFCIVATPFGLMTFVCATAVISEHNVTKANVMAISATVSGITTTMFIFLALCALADGRRTRVDQT